MSLLICAWCRKVMDWNHPSGGHGMCADCIVEWKKPVAKR